MSGQVDYIEAVRGKEDSPHGSVGICSSPFYKQADYRFRRLAKLCGLHA